ncbi:uncharacterized protein F5147DRAFT_781850 [Suillus discolor]|uniref:Uncharacterized protein n=1 Tax=Suillus discolor TaxID=1912936 RepID=A0A9P7JL38_9AGAM|nr:uncharacterized protein F5147DRAFT_781850 [Suillus discolor]KAG2085891.1 hypothetical protein F5147DRAFT_781850 [Suillus discolor]
MTIPPEAANEALNVTLTFVQLLMKRCIEVKKDDPEALRLSDEIAKRVAKDLKLYGGNATSFSPQLLSFAAVIRQHSRGGTFESVPNWTSVIDDDPRIKSHLRFQKTVHYRQPSADVPAIATLTAISTAVPTTMTLIVPPLTPSALPRVLSHMESDLLSKLVVEPKLSLRRARKNPPVLRHFPAGPLARFHHLYGTAFMRKPENAVLQVSNSKKWKAEDEDRDEATAVAKAKLPSPSEEPAKKRKKLISNVQKGPTGTILVKTKGLPVTTDQDILLVNKKDFRDTATRPAEWGSDSHIATPRQHSVHYHPRQCDKCTKLNMPCVVLPDKKFGYTCLACANCDSMKIACAIDGVGVRQRLQGKSAKASSNPAKYPRTTKSAPCPLPEQNIIEHKEAEKKPMDILPGQMQMHLEHRQSPAPTSSLESEPTPRYILQSIQDLSRRLDLLATNERVDRLEARAGLVETNLLKLLNELEERFNASNARQQSMASLA